MTDVRIPAEAPQDAVMSTPAEVAAMAEWVARTLLGTQPVNAAAVDLTVRRQDHALLHTNESCLETPLRIGGQDFRRGLGTHANSEIVVRVPAGAQRFEAKVGVDDNYDTQGGKGSVEFRLAAGERELFRSPVVRGGDAAVAVSVPVPAGVTEFLLTVDCTPDGTAFDQADWADARFVLADGRDAWLDENQALPFLSAARVPFSFQYGEKPVASLLGGWKRSVESRQADGWTEHTVNWDDPETGLRVTAAVRVFRRYAAADWILYLENRGQADTPIVEGIQALDVDVCSGSTKRAVVLHQIAGDTCGERTFLPMETALTPGNSLRFAPAGGRPSNGAFPFFNLQYRDDGLFTAIGWSGQWACALEREASTGATRLRAGQEQTHLRLHPGERIRSPRILLMRWTGDRLTAHNRFRRLLLYEYAPKLDGRPLALPFVSQCFDRYSWSRPEWATEAGQVAGVQFAKEIGCDAYWFDAAWFVGGFPNGVGNWFAKPKEFPRGLGPVGEACHRLGMRFVLWFEPERVAPGTQIAREHPEFVFGGDKGGLFKLSDAVARRWLTDLLSQRIGEFGIDVYRNDFNIDPLPYWRQNDEPDRQGLTEIRYVEGHYEMWDELRARHPGLWIDNCASGGRRIDLETIMRSVPLWRSDTSCSPGHPEWNQAQTYGLSLYLPLQTACGWTPDPYEFRSSATGGAICQWAYLDPAFPRDLARATMAEARANSPFWYGDFYPLTGCSLAMDHWIAYQLHRPDLGAGIALVFRRPQSPYPALALELRGLNPGTTYRVDCIDDARAVVSQEVSGRDLMSGWELRLPAKASSRVVRYRAAPAK